MKAISLFSSAGIGDLGLRENGIDTVLACEIIKERMDLFQENFPNTKCFCGDIWELSSTICNYYISNYTDSPFLIIATPPCQGMSSNGMGKLLSDYRKGIRPKLDPRNRLIIPAIDIIKRLKPQWIIFENVANMLNTVIIDEKDNLVNIIDYISHSLSPDYSGKAELIDCADYGVPQNRKRLVTIFSRSKKGKKYFRKSGSFLPIPTHGIEKKPWKTVRDAIANVHPLSAEKGKNVDTNYHILHSVPLLDEKKLFWIKNTPEGATAFNNQCVNPKCLYQNNPIHGASIDKNGINRNNENTPIYCQKCGELLPRPWVENSQTGQKRLMKGYVSAYKRMMWDQPASTLTQNFQYACSDNKIHPEQNRVLSIYEGIIIQTISNYSYSFSYNGKKVKDGLIRDVIGESIPPLITDLICKKILDIEY